MLGYWAWGDSVVRSIAVQLAADYGDILIEKSRGKVTSPSFFIETRLRELISLIIVACGLVIASWLLYRWIARFCSPLWLWLPTSLIAFTAVNLFVGSAAETGTFWTTLFALSEDSKQPAFHINRISHLDSQAKTKVIVLGSSQAGSEIEETILNRKFGPNIHVANLSYAGASPVDFLLIEEWYQHDRPDVVICYLSELSFYTTASGSRLLPLLKPTAWPILYDLNASAVMSEDAIVNGLIASTLPLFQSRRGIEYAVFRARPLSSRWFRFVDLA